MACLGCQRSTRHEAFLGPGFVTLKDQGVWLDLRLVPRKYLYNFVMSLRLLLGMNIYHS